MSIPKVSGSTVVDGPGPVTAQEALPVAAQASASQAAPLVFPGEVDTAANKFAGQPASKLPPLLLREGAELTPEQQKVKDALLALGKIPGKKDNPFLIGDDARARIADGVVSKYDKQYLDATIAKLEGRASKGGPIAFGGDPTPRADYAIYLGQVKDLREAVGNLKSAQSWETDGAENAKDKGPAALDIRNAEGQVKLDEAFRNVGQPTAAEFIFGRRR